MQTTEHFQIETPQRESCLDDFIFPFFVLAPIFLGIAIYVYFLFLQFSHFCFEKINQILTNNNSPTLIIALVCGMIATKVITSQVSEKSSRLKISTFSFFALITTVFNLILFAKIAIQTEFLYNIYSYMYNYFGGTTISNTNIFTVLKLDPQSFHIIFSGIIGSVLFVAPIIFLFGLVYFLIFESNEKHLAV